MTFEKIETAVYVLLWAFAIYVAAGKLEDQPAPPAKQTEASAKLTSKQVIMGVRK